jgi:2-amino-4-hydroxy-6-hydroxymethyldihydropteridine diphosphokinase
VGRAASLAIALGANLPSPAGDPLATLLAVRPLLESLLRDLGQAVCWSPLFRTAPVGGPPGQPDYLNGAVLVSRASAGTTEVAVRLLEALQELEQRFARQRLERWGPRSLDLDLLWWGDLACRSEQLELPHPRLQARPFVLAPLATIDGALVPPGTDLSVATLLRECSATSREPAPERLAGRAGWPE